MASPAISHRALAVRSLTLLVGIAATLSLVGPTESARAAYPGENGKIAFVDHDADGSGFVGIWTMNPDGTGRTELPGVGTNDENPAWSPDGQRIAFSRFNPDNNGCAFGEVWVMNADGTGQVQLTSTPGAAEVDPTWSPDGQTLAYTRIISNPGCTFADADIWSMNADGSNQTQLTSGGVATGFPATDQEPAWSPDGGKIAFRSNRDDQNGDSYEEIYSINPDGTGLTKLTNTLAQDFSHAPAWSPDGQKIAFERLDLDGFVDRIWTMNRNGGGEAALTTNGFDSNIQPAWSPDGQKLLFSGGSVGVDSEVFAINPDGTGQAPLTDTPTSELAPDWQPIVDPGAGDVVVTDCTDPDLATLTEVTGDLIVESVAGCDDFSMPNLTEVIGSIVITDIAAETIDIGSLVTVGGSIDIGDVPGAETIDIASLVTAGGSINIGDVPEADVIDIGSLSGVTGSISITDVPEADSIDIGALTGEIGGITVSGADTAETIDIGSLVTTSGSISIEHNANANAIDVGGLVSATGSISITDNSTETAVDTSALDQVDGDATLETAGSDVDLSGADVDGDLTLTGNGADTISANTAGGATEVNVGQGTASMHVVLPGGSFAQPVGFTITRQGDGAGELGTTAGGDPAEVDPLAGYGFSFDVPTLNEDAQLAFAVDLAELDAPTRAALLAGVATGTATTAVKGDEPGAAYQAFDQCTGAQTPAADGCVSVTVLAADGLPPEGGEDPAFVLFDGIVGHFSTYSVALVTPVPPALSIGDVSMPEGNSATTDFEFAISLDRPAPDGGVSVDFATVDGTATQPSDYASSSGTAEIAAGASGTQVVIEVSGDTTVEPDENLSVGLSNASGASIADATGAGTVENDDAPPPPQRSLSVVRSGNGGGNVNSAPIGIDCGADCNQSYANGSTVLLTASAAPGSTFSGWTNCHSAIGNVCQMTLGADVNVTAGFAAAAPAPPPPDTTAPETTLVSGPKKTTRSKTATFVFSSTEPGSTFECDLDGKGFEPCSSPEKFKCKPGKHQVLIRAIDAAGNVDETPAEQRWKVKKKRKKTG